MFTAVLVAAPLPSALAASASYQTAADNFVVLGGSAVTLTNATVSGDVGVDAGGAYTATSSTVSGTVHVGDLAAQQAYDNFLIAYTDLSNVACGTDLTGQSLAGMTLTPGVYCFDAAATETGGTLTLDGPPDGIWIFKIGGRTGALTATNFTVVTPRGFPCDNNVFWWTAQAATLTDSTFVGNIFAGTSITVTRGTLQGQALAKDAVTLTGASICGPVAQHPVLGFRGSVTGGGQIQVPTPTSPGEATFGFNAKANGDGTAKGQFNYLNHVTGLHINGSVEQIMVTVTNPDGSAKTIQFSGTYKGGTFVVTVQDNGEPGTSDRFGVVIAGASSEVESERVISRGNIQFHK